MDNTSDTIEKTRSQSDNSSEVDLEQVNDVLEPEKSDESNGSSRSRSFIDVKPFSRVANMLEGKFVSGGDQLKKGLRKGMKADFRLESVFEFPGIIKSQTICYNSTQGVHKDDFYSVLNSTVRRSLIEYMASSEKEIFSLKKPKYGSDDMRQVSAIKNNKDLFEIESSERKSVYATLLETGVDQLNG